MDNQSDIILVVEVYHKDKLFGYEKLTNKGWFSRCPELDSDNGERWTSGVMHNSEDFTRKLSENKRFIMPTDKELVDFALIFNNGKNNNQLVDMVAVLTMVTERLYENGNIKTPTKQEVEDSIKEATCIDKILNVQTRQEKANSCIHPKECQSDYHDSSVYCSECESIIEQFGEKINPPTPLF